jgi:DNA-binding transcriptional LysR family regulator
MNWDNIRVFLAVARASQFSGAASQLGLDVATVGRRVNALESSLNFRLLERGRTGCVLSAAGERFYRAADEVESQILRAQSDLSRSDIEVAGTIRIAAPDAFSTLFLCPRVGSLKAKHPGLTVQLVPISRTFSLSKREADIAVTLERPAKGRLVARKLIDYSLHLYASRPYLKERGIPSRAEDLQHHCLVAYVQDLILAEQLTFMPEIYGPTYSRLECSTAVGQLEAVRGGAGIGVLHDYTAQQSEGLEIVLPDIRFDRTYWLVTHLDTRGLSRIQAAVEHILGEVSMHKRMFQVK